MLEIDNLIFETGTEESERKAARGGDPESGTELQRLSVVIRDPGDITIRKDSDKGIRDREEMLASPETKAWREARTFTTLRVTGP